MNENMFSKLFVGELRRYDWDVQRIEDKLSEGIPDMSIAKDGIEYWIETKVFAWAKREASNTQLKVRTAQVNWLQRRASKGARCLLAAYEVHERKILLLNAADFKRGNVISMSGDESLGSPYNKPKQELMSKALAYAPMKDVIIMLNNKEIMKNEL